jgi:MFS family permease
VKCFLTVQRLNKRGLLLARHLPALASRTAFVLLFEYPHYGRLWFGNVVSQLGDQAGWIALVWLLLHMTGSASSVGWVTLLYQLPSIITSPVAGVLLDRFPRARVMAAGNLVLAILFIAITLVSFHHTATSVWVIYGLVGIAGVVLPLNTTGGGPLLTELIPQEKLSQANFLVQSVWQLALLLGPAIGGILVGAVGPEAVIAIDAATFVMVALILMRLPVRRDGTVAQPKSPWHDFYSGLRYLLTNRPLVALTILTLLFNLFYGPYEVILPLLAKNDLGGPSALGLLWTTFSVGSLAGSIGFSTRSWRYSTSVSLALVILLWGVITIAMAYARTLLLVLFIMFVAGVVFTPWGPLVMTVRQMMVPIELQGRVIGTTSSLTRVGTPLGAWMTGLFVGDISPTVILLASGAVTMGVGVLALLWPDFRKIDG